MCDDCYTENCEKITLNMLTNFVSIYDHHKTDAEINGYDDDATDAVIN